MVEKTSAAPTAPAAAPAPAPPTPAADGAGHSAAHNAANGLTSSVSRTQATKGGSKAAAVNIVENPLKVRSRASMNCRADDRLSARLERAGRS